MDAGRAGFAPLSASGLIARAAVPEGRRERQTGNPGRGSRIHLHPSPAGCDAFARHANLESPRVSHVDQARGNH